MIIDQQVSSPMGPPKGGLKSRSHTGFSHKSRSGCLKFMFMPSLPNHAEYLINLSRNNATIFIQFPFSRSEICPGRFACKLLAYRQS